MEVKRQLLYGPRGEADPEHTEGELLNPPALPLLEPENKETYFTHPPLPPLVQPSKPIPIPTETTTNAPTKPITVTPKSATGPTLFIQKLKSKPQTTLPSFIPTFLPLASQSSSQSDFQTQPPPQPNLLNHHPNPCDSYLLHLNHHRKIFSLNPKNPPISSQVVELFPCDSWRRRRRRLISQRAVNLPLLNLLLHQRRERMMMWRSWMWGT